MTTWTTRDKELLDSARFVLNRLGWAIQWEKGVQGIREFRVCRSGMPAWEIWKVADEARDGEWILASIVNYVLWQEKQ